MSLELSDKLHSRSPSGKRLSYSLDGMLHAINPRAVIGANFPPDDLPPKGQRIVNLDRARQLEIAVCQIKALYHVPKCRIMEKRKGGEDGRALRRFLIFYARGLGCPVWECANLFDLDRKQIGQEEASYLDMLARNPALEADVENMTSMIDYAIRVKTKRFITVSLSEIQAEQAARKAVKTAKEAADLLEANAPKPKPKKSEPTAAERIQAEANAKHKAEALARSEKILDAVIAKGEATGATKEQKKDAQRARAAKAEIAASRKKPAKA